MITAAGFLIVAPSPQGELYWLVLQAHNHKTWLPPKGVVEAGEKLLESAARELYEETGFDVKDFETRFDLTYSTKYHAWGQEKTTHYFVLKTMGEELPSPTLSDEHIGYKWATVEEYKELEPRLVEMHRILEEAEFALKREGLSDTVS